MNSYRIKLVSQTNIFLLLFSLLLITFILIATVDLRSVAILVVVGMFALAVYLWRKCVTGITRWTLTEEGISINWEKRFFMAKTTDYFFKWSDIRRIWKGLDPNYYNLKFEFKSGERIVFFHDRASDDFNELLLTLYKMWDEKSK